MGGYPVMVCVTKRVTFEHSQGLGADLAPVVHDSWTDSAPRQITLLLHSEVLPLSSERGRTPSTTFSLLV